MHENEIGMLNVESAVHLHQDLSLSLLETNYEATFSVAPCLCENKKRSELTDEREP